MLSQAQIYISYYLPWHSQRKLRFLWLHPVSPSCKAIKGSRWYFRPHTAVLSLDDVMGSCHKMMLLLHDLRTQTSTHDYFSRVVVTGNNFFFFQCWSVCVFHSWAYMQSMCLRLRILASSIRCTAPVPLLSSCSALRVQGSRRWSADQPSLQFLLTAT